MKLFLPFFLFVLISCSKSDVNPEIQLFTNTDVENGTGSFPTQWLVNNSPNAACTWSDQVAYSGTHSLRIESLSSKASFDFWSQGLTNDIPVGKNLTLTVRIKGNLTGEGVAAAISCLSSPSQAATQFSTTEGKTSITGNMDWTEYTVKLNNVQSDIKLVVVYLILLPNTTGEVYFDDIVLTAN